MRAHELIEQIANQIVDYAEDQPIHYNPSTYARDLAERVQNEVNAIVTQKNK